MKLRKGEYRQLIALANSHTPLWGGVYESGQYDAELVSWLERGLVRKVDEPYVANKRVAFNGGFRITDAGRLALREKGAE